MSEAGKKWLRVAHAREIPRREGREVEIAGRKIAIFHLPEGFFAVVGECPHRGGPLADGMVSGTAIVCPLHGRKFDLVTGQMLAEPSTCVKTFPVRVADGTVSVQLPLGTSDEEKPSQACEHRDRPLRWVQRKPSPPLRDAAGR